MARGPIPNKATTRPTARVVADMIYQYYQMPGHDVGGALHIILDDDNWSDRCVNFCRSWALEGKCHCGRTVCEPSVLLADALLAMTQTQRRRANALSRNYWR